MEKKYYQKHKQRLWKETREKYQNLSQEKKDKKVEKGSRQTSNFYLRRKRKEVSVLSGT